MTSRIWVLVGLLAVAAGFGGGWLGGRAKDKPAVAREPAGERADEPVEVRAAEGSVEERVAVLEREVGRLRRERDVARAMAAMAGSGEDAAAPKSAAVDDPVFEAAVRDVMDRIDAEKTEERTVRRTERIREFSERWADQVETPLALTPEQKRKVTEIMREHFEAMSRWREEREAGGGDGGRESFRDRMRSNREALDQRLGEVLDRRQQDKLGELRESGELPGFWGGGRGRGRGGR
jgi:hypothetical protein